MLNSHLNSPFLKLILNTFFLPGLQISMIHSNHVIFTLIQPSVKNPNKTFKFTSQKIGQLANMYISNKITSKRCYFSTNQLSESTQSTNISITNRVLPLLQVVSVLRPEEMFECVFTCGADCKGTSLYPCLQIFVNNSESNSVALLHFDEQQLVLNPKVTTPCFTVWREGVSGMFFIMFFFIS